MKIPSLANPVDPVIVCGMPRSGVRLLGAVLDGHPQLASGPELPFVTTMTLQWLELRQTLGTNHEMHYGVSAESTRRAFRAATLKLFAERLAITRKERFVVQSLAAALALDACSALFPESRFLVLVRDPRAVSASLLHCNWHDPRDGRALPYTQSAAAAGRYWMSYLQLMMPGIAALRAAQRLLVVRYEDLCERPSATLHRIGAFLGLCAASSTLTAQAADLVTRSSDQPHPPLRSGSIDSASVQRWRSEMTVNDIEAVEQIASARRAFGYE